LFLDILHVIFILFFCSMTLPKTVQINWICIALLKWTKYKQDTNFKQSLRFFFLNIELNFEIYNLRVFELLSSLRIIIFGSNDSSLLTNLKSNFKLHLTNQWPTQNNDLLHPRFFLKFVICIDSYIKKLPVNYALTVQMLYRNDNFC